VTKPPSSGRKPKAGIVAPQDATLEGDERLKRIEAVIEGLPPDERVEYREMVVQTMFNGPLPPPALYARYEEVLPGAAERIMALTEREQEHRHRFEADALHAEVRYSNLGMWLGAGVLFCVLIAACFCAYVGQNEVAIAIAGLGVAGVVGAFIRGKGSHRSDKNGKS
jgi:uncharacterized membrane protein